MLKLPASGNMREVACFSVVFAVLVLSLGGCTLGHTADQADGTQTTEAADSAASSPQIEDVAPLHDGRSVAQRLQDASKEAQVKQALVQQRKLRIFDFEAEVNGAHLTLRGDVNTRSQRELAGRLAQRISGIETVDNVVTVGGVPAEEVESKSTAGTAQPQAPATAYHTVEAGETLWNIARQYNASVRQIKRLNNIETGAIHPGQRLRVR